jgi:hypothetical protein
MLSIILIRLSIPLYKGDVLQRSGGDMGTIHGDFCWWVFYPKHVE